MSLSYRAELKAAMESIAEDDKSIFVGQAIAFAGTAMSASFADIATEKLLESPVDEELQLGMSIGLGLSGYAPVSVFPRWNFLLLALNQLINHLDKAREVFNFEIPPKVLIRTSIGSSSPMHPGPQHLGDFTDAVRMLSTNLEFVSLESAEQIRPAYRDAFQRDDGVSSVLVEYGNRTD